MLSRVPLPFTGVSPPCPPAPVSPRRVTLALNYSGRRIRMPRGQHRTPSVTPRPPNSSGGTWGPPWHSELCPQPAPPARLLLGGLYTPGQRGEGTGPGMPGGSGRGGGLSLHPPARPARLMGFRWSLGSEIPKNPAAFPNELGKVTPRPARRGASPSQSLPRGSGLYWGGNGARGSRPGATSAPQQPPRSAFPRDRPRTCSAPSWE